MLTFTTLQLEALSSLFAILANSKRLEILLLLTEGKICVGQLASKTGLSQSALSQHLAKMRQRGLVTFRRDAQTIYYRCENPVVEAVLGMLHAMRDNPSLFQKSDTACRRIPG